MSARERNLLILLLIAGFLIVNFFGFGIYTERKAAADRDLVLARTQLENALIFRENSAQIADEMDWLAEHEPDAAPSQEVQSALQQFAETQAKNLGLTIRSQEFPPTDESGVHFHRAQFRINLTGQEAALYRWLDAVNDPSQLRAAYQVRLSPNGQDDALIDCSATLAQWFQPTL